MENLFKNTFIVSKDILSQFDLRVSQNFIVGTLIFFLTRNRIDDNNFLGWEGVIYYYVQSMIENNEKNCLNE